MKLTVPLGLLLFAGVLVFRMRPSAPVQAGVDVPSAAGIPADPTRFLILPQVVQGMETALALDGGALPIAGGQIPSVLIGENILRTVHLAWIHDWTREECRDIFRDLHDLYASEEGKSLPALRIHLNPVFSDAEGEAMHRAMLQAYFRADDRHLYHQLARRLCSGSFPATPAAVRAEVEATEPLLIHDWEQRLDWLENDIEKTFTIARTQAARNASVLGENHRNQLTSMTAILPPAADRGSLIDFLRKADACQRTWLHRNPAPAQARAPSR